MQQLTVPQFIDVEDKIIGPLSVRQFITILVVVGLIAICYKLFDFSLFLFSGIILLIVGSVFAFIKVNGSPFHYFLLNIFQTLRKPRLRVWNKSDESKVVEEKEPVITYQESTQPRRYSTSRLNRLALIVDTRGYYSGEDEESELKAEDKINNF